MLLGGRLMQIMMLRVQSKGFTLIELLIVVALIGIIAATAMPVLMRARMSGNEASAIGSIRAVVSAQADFESIAGGFADDLATLAAICPGMNTAFLSPDLGSNNIVKSGYGFTLAAGQGSVIGPADCFGNPSQTTYYVSATPASFGVTGTRAFASNNAATVWQDTTGVAPTEPFAIAGTVGPLR